MQDRRIAQTVLHADVHVGIGLHAASGDTYQPSAYASCPYVSRVVYVQTLD